MEYICLDFVPPLAMSPSHVLQDPHGVPLQ